MKVMKGLLCVLGGVLSMSVANAQTQLNEATINGWSMQDVAKVTAAGAEISIANYKLDGWYKATVPGTVLTTLVDNKVYPEPLYGENMREIPESLNKTSYWYRTTFAVPKTNKGRHTWLHFAGVNYSAVVWVNGQKAGEMRGAFVRGDFDVTAFVKPGKTAALAVLVSPQPHPGEPHEHTVANGVGKNGGETAIDGPTFLSTIGWDWLPAVRDRDTGIWLPVTMSATGPVVVKDTFVQSDLAKTNDAAELAISTTVQNLTEKPVKGVLVATVTGGDAPVTIQKDVTLEPMSTQDVTFDKQHVANPKLWWPNGYGPQNLYHVTVRFDVGKKTSDEDAEAVWDSADRVPGGGLGEPDAFGERREGDGARRQLGPG